MKPIKLEIEGIHSFIEKQVIDFNSIRGIKLFGIFGQTGSGKSTILDSIILALYGQIGRSKSNSDFINLRSKKARVCFEFVINEQNKQKTYIVERVYTKKNNAEVEQSANVYEKNTFGKTQVVEGALKVDKFIKQAVGLTESEFTKCVALQQGEFASFLKSRPSERINLIGSIFDLNKFGTELWEKIKDASAEKEKQLAVLDGKIEQFKSLDEFTIEDQEKEYVKLQKEIEDLSIDLSKKEKAFAKEKELVAYEQELAEINKELQDNAKLGTTISDKKLKIKKAKKINENEFLINSVFSADDSLKQEEENLLLLQNEYTKENQVSSEFTSRTKQAIENAEIEVVKLVSEIAEQEGKLKSANKLKELNEIRALLIEDGSKLELSIADLNGQKSKLDKNLQRLKEEYNNQNNELELININLAKLDCLKQYDFMADKVLTYDKYIDYADIKMNKSLNVKIKSQHKIDELENKELELTQQLNALYEKFANNEEVGSLFFYKQIKDRNALINKCNITEEYIKGKQEQINYTQQQINALNLDISEYKDEILLYGVKDNDYINEIASVKEYLKQLNFKKSKMLAQNSVVEFSEKIKIGDNCPICNSEIISKNIIGKLDMVVVDEEIAQTNQKIDNLLYLKNDNLKDCARAEAKLEMASKSVERLLSNVEMLNKDIQTRCAKSLNRKYASLNDLAVAELKIKDEIKQLEKLQLQEIKLKSKLNQILQDKTKYNIMFVSASEKCDELLELIDSLVEERENLKSAMLKIADSDKLTALRAELDMNLLNRARVESDALNTYNNITEHEDTIRNITEQIATKVTDNKLIAERLKVINNQILEHRMIVKELDDVIQIELLINNTKEKLSAKQTFLAENRKSLEHLNEKLTKIASKLFNAKTIYNDHKASYDEQRENLLQSLRSVGISNFDMIAENKMSEQDIENIEAFIADYDAKLAVLLDRQKELVAKINDRNSQPQMIEQIQNNIIAIEESLNYKRENAGKLSAIIESAKRNLIDLNDLKQKRESVNNLYKVDLELLELLRGKALLEYVAEEYINDITYMASDKIQYLMDGQYVLLYKDKEFYVTDNFNGGITRPVNTLSGGEVFVVSLALALSISDAIMARSDKKIDFFFLDEGFGTLDKEYCEYIVSSLTKLSSPNMTIGLISHIPELQEKISKKFIVTKPTQTKGSQIVSYVDL